MNILIQDLQVYERRPSELIRDEICRQFVDVTNVKATHEYDSSVFPLDASQKLFYSAKKMVIAAAAATLKRRGYFGKSVPLRAREQARAVLVGHTRPGSYVVPVVSRAQLPDVSWDDKAPRLVENVEEASFDRRMVVTLARSLTVLHELVVAREAEPTKREVHDGVGEGLSYELCDGVIRSLNDPVIEEFKVGFEWAPAIARPPGLDTNMEFPSESLERIRRIARGLRKETEDREQVVYGWVEVLASKAEDVGGWVRVHAMVNGRHRVIRMTLDSEDYEKAHASHKKCPVIVRGDLHLEAGKLATMEVHSFALEQSIPGV
ncbi:MULTISPECIES: hypothetical protein [Micromonospora]|uniref:hypothetical protein n=1 Tax=Micromonospora TaxID=1873 RepID=UPI0033EDCD58